MSFEQWLSLLVIAAAVIFALTAAAIFTVAVLNARPLTWPRRHRRARTYPPPPDFVFTIPVGEQPSPPWHRTTARGYTVHVQTRHVRQVGPEGPNPAGGVPGDALCGHPLNGGNPDVPEQNYAITLPWDGQPAIEPCYHCARAHEEALDRYEREVGIPPPTAREQRAWERYRRQHT